MEHTTRPGTSHPLHRLLFRLPTALAEAVEIARGGGPAFGPAYARFVNMTRMLSWLKGRPSSLRWPLSSSARLIAVLIIGARPSADGQSCENKNRTKVSPSPAKVSPENIAAS